MVVLDYSGGKGGGMTAAKYQKQVLEGAFHGFYEEVKEEKLLVDFLQDGAPSHHAKSTLRWFNDAGIYLVDHPANSPDLNPIEPIWHDLKEIVHSLESVSTVEGLKSAVQKAWDMLPIETANKHILWMPDQVKAVLAAKGGHTPY